MSDLRLITARRQEVQAEVERHREAIQNLEAELVELTTAERVLLRLSGSKPPLAAVAVDESAAMADTVTETDVEVGGSDLEDVEEPAGADEPTEDNGANQGTPPKPPGTPVLPDMILAVLRDARNEGLEGLAPNDVRLRISERWWPGVVNNHVRPTVWRMWKTGKLEKDEGTQLYRLPQNYEAADDNPDQETSATSLFDTPAQGREAGPGGGT